ncbi:phage tail tape measure protein [Gilliamella sp. B2824]|uniref:phage tail tape measure protein n=1 Tax=Gilliamella sp. B2824 TaxID=2818019 RepID=UPI00226AF49B|nr:phage tail tape measure protein [Gilliamella sp. B2824]MCX8739027.1 phage tail tape measure protein [Gilliamella sp. B2824]
MAEQITSLTLKINVKSVTEVNKKLDDFTKKADAATVASDRFSNAQLMMNSKFSQITKSIDYSRISLNEYQKSLIFSSNTTRSLIEFNDKLFKSFKNQIDSVRNLTSASKELKNARKDLSVTNTNQSKETTPSVGNSFANKIKTEIGKSFNNLLTTINPINIGISALSSFLTGLVPKLFETESATEKLAAAQDRLNKVLDTDKNTGFTFLSDEMMNLLGRNRALVEAMVKSSKIDLDTIISVIKQQLHHDIENATDGLVDLVNSANSMGMRAETNLNSVLNSIDKLKSGSKIDLDEIENIELKTKKLAEYYGMTYEGARRVLEQLADIRSETDSIKVEEKINNLIEELSHLYLTSENSSNKFKMLIDSLFEIEKKANNASLKLKSLKLITNLEQAQDPKKSPFYQYERMIMNPRQRTKAELDEMNRLADAANKIFKKDQPGYVTEDKRNAVAAAIEASNSSRGNSTTNLLQTSQQQEISLRNQLQELQEQSLAVEAITSERRKYLDLQNQIQVLESSNNKKRLTEEEKYVLAHKEALLTQYAKNAAIGDEIAQYEAAAKAIQKMKEYTANLTVEAQIKQATFGMSSKDAARQGQLQQLDINKQNELDKTADPSQIENLTKQYDQAKQTLQESWQQEDANQGNWLMGLKVGLLDYANTAQDVFSAAKGFAQNTIGSMSDMMTQLVTTGKANFKDFARTILTNLIEIINKLILAKIIQSAMSWMGFSDGGVGKATGGLQNAYSGGEIRGYATGGNVGYALKPGGFTGRGNKYQPAGIVHKGEFVFTKEATKRIGVGSLYALMNDKKQEYASGGYVDVGQASPIAFTRQSNQSTSAVNVSANIAVNMSSENNSATTTTNNIDAKAVEAQVGAVIQQRMNEMMKKLVSPGGDLYNVMHAR